jgi:hypothetical protein
MKEIEKETDLITKNKAPYNGAFLFDKFFKAEIIK